MEEFAGPNRVGIRRPKARNLPWKISGGFFMWNSGNHEKTDVAVSSTLQGKSDAGRLRFFIFRFCPLPWGHFPEFLSSLFLPFA
jgi:hypothetical protein